MDFDEIKQILAMVREHELAEFELEHQGFKIRIRKDGGAHRGGRAAAGGRGRPLPAVAAQAPAAPAPAPPRSRLPPRTASWSWRSSSRRSSARSIARPSRAPGRLLESATPCRKGQVLCIIEAMKLMNEIESEYDGEVVKVYVENGQAVQFGERLFAIKAK